jgi:hypothetical protein
VTVDYVAVLAALYPNSPWAVDGSDYDGLTWLDENTPMPSRAELDAAWPAVEYDLSYALVRVARHAAYAAPDGHDAIFLQWQRGDAKEQDWLDAVQAVKDAHPYPEKP